MAQHDMVIDNGPGLAVRTDMNAAIEALVTTSSGPVEPTTKYPGQLWLDTTVAPDGQLKQRNQSNTAWVDMAQTAVGFTPVEQAGGTSMVAGKVRIGANASGNLLAQLGTVALGEIFTTVNCPFQRVSNRGYQKLPSGLIIQWGIDGAGQADGFSVVYPTAFPNGHLAVCVTMKSAPSATQLHAVSFIISIATAFSIYQRQVTGSTVSVLSNGVEWIALGW